MGWLALFAIGPIINALSTAGLWFLFIGGLFFILLERFFLHVAWISLPSYGMAFVCNCRLYFSFLSRILLHLTC